MTWALLLTGEVIAPGRAARGATFLARPDAPPNRLWFDVAPLAFWGIVLAAAGLCLMLPHSRKWARRAGSVIGLVGLGLLASDLPPLAGYVSRGVFWILAGATVVSAAAAVAARSAVYAALWFALSLLGSAGLFLFQGAQFLAAATVLIYAGAIVVTFLFVLMLAQPQGRAPYDRISWGWTAKPAAVLAAAAMAAMVALAIDCLREGGLREKAASALSRTQGPNELSLIREDQLCSVTREQRGQRSRLRVTLRSDAQLNETVRRELEQRLVRVFCQPGGSGPSPSPVEVEIEYLDAQQDVLDPSHMAHFGGQLFGRHLVSVEAAGALLLAALVGAVAILIQGKQLREHGESPGHE